MIPTPVHDKLKALGDEREHVQNFIDWLLDEARAPGTANWTEEEEEDAKIVLGWWRERTDAGHRLNYPILEPTSWSRQNIMSAYFGIDLKKLDDEKKAMLDEFRESQKENP